MPLASFGAATAIAVAVLALAPLSSDVQSTGSIARRHVVEIRDLEFTPKELAVSPGDTIIWVNHDLVAHTVTADDMSWDSGLVPSRGQWRTVVLARMNPLYYCRYHPSMTARLRIVGR